MCSGTSQTGERALQSWACHGWRPLHDMQGGAGTCSYSRQCSCRSYGSTHKLQRCRRQVSAGARTCEDLEGIFGLVEALQAAQAARGAEPQRQSKVRQRLTAARAPSHAPLQAAHTRLVRVRPLPVPLQTPHSAAHPLDFPNCSTACTRVCSMPDLTDARRELLLCCRTKCMTVGAAEAHHCCTCHKIPAKMCT